MHQHGTIHHHHVNIFAAGWTISLSFEESMALAAVLAATDGLTVGGILDNLGWYHGLATSSALLQSLASEPLPAQMVPQP